MAIELGDPSRESVSDTVKTEDPKTDNPLEQLQKWADDINIANHLPDEVLNELGMLVKTEYDIDERSRSDWVEKTKKAMALAMQVAEIKQYPWPKASNVIYPLMTVAAVQFAARAYPAIVSGRNVVKGMVVGDDTGLYHHDPQSGQTQMITPPGERATRAAKIGDHMSYQLLDE